MNKKLIALAIASAISAPAMAATGNVDIYGLMSVAVDSVQNGDASLDTTPATTTHNTNRVGRFSDYASRIGFKGSEDLGNGLSAIWQIEQQINVDNNGAAGTGNAFGGAGLRNTFLGLKSKDLGSVLGGRYDTPYKVATGRLDPFADTMGDYNGVVGAASATGAGSYFDQRPSNVVDYISPNWSGLSVAAAYAFGAETAVNNVAVTDKNANLYSLAAMYDAGPFFLSAAYEKHNFGSAGVGTFAGAPNTDESAYKIGAGYSIMDFTLGALYEKTKDNRGVGGANLLGHSAYYLSGKYHRARRRRTGLRKLPRRQGPGQRDLSAHRRPACRLPRQATRRVQAHRATPRRRHHEDGRAQPDPQGHGRSRHLPAGHARPIARRAWQRGAERRSLPIQLFRCGTRPTPPARPPAR